MSDRGLFLFLFFFYSLCSAMNQMREGVGSKSSINNKQPDLNYWLMKGSGLKRFAYQATGRNIAVSFESPAAEHFSSFFPFFSPAELLY